ncbi:DEAD/DEAH box helicase family protein [Belliella kenyensis]|uniref:DEAD/DEAH box helicase family protein n=1 Tax=Belliella kenyensis TaxID=1472724 RepID=A0ABV8EP45_9BACT|nr:DEAD/DEAH box helicase [Belliella kenyensis]MCH7403611.1 DEAD/DEAH box helicase [Belliella kenyensis]MDN3603837.1 DEAD/DEAH box helicase family protein [Belliella kenyensis]
MQNNLEHINIFKALFKAREDVFAIRWEKNSKSGYMPAYFYDPYRFRAHKMNGGTFQNFTEKSYLKLTDEQIQKHLDGFHHIGIYPLLQDNSTWFLAADFDKANWQNEAITFLNACKENAIPAYLERSRSGNGGHVWIFFDKPYPAIRSRKIFISILEQSGAFSMFDKSSSFDRLFPNQDFLSGKGFGNLIALPLFKPAFELGKSCFINPESFEPIADQWDFLKNIKRVSTNHLDELYDALKPSVQALKSGVESNTSVVKNGTLSISLNNNVRLSRIGLTPTLINFLKEELNFANSEFFIKKKSGRNTYETARYFKLIEETESEIFIPRGFIGRLLRFCKESQIEFEFVDERKLKPSIPFSFNAALRNHQLDVIETVSKKDFGVIVAPPGSGKTIIGLKIIANKGQPTLIIVHRKQLLEQWTERIEAFLGIPKRDIGVIGQGKSKIGKHITLATIQSLPKQIEFVQNQFGTILVDECHHVPAETFRSTIEKLQVYYLYGLTATPFRKYSDGKMIFTHLGEIIANIQSAEIENYKQAKIIIRNTELDVPYNSKTDSFEALSKILVHDTTRNKLILEDVKKELNQGKKAVIITERKEHIDTLYLFLKQSYEVIALSGEDSETSKKAKWKILQEGNFQVLITTGQYFGEGTDLQNINCLFLVYPFSFEGKLIQYIGRVQRSEINPTIYDYRDYKIDYLNKLFLKRNTYYRKIDKQATLFDEPKDEIITSNHILTIEKKIKVSIEELEFYYGSVAFKYTLNEMNTTLEFQVENIEMRPEFEVLKPYFIKTLKSKNITVEIFAEFENGKLVSQLALSTDIDRINKEVIEGVKFQFLNKGLLKQFTPKKQNIITSDELQEQGKFFSNAEELLNEILKNKQYKHSRHIQYLADKHENQVMKIRFVLNPFSFVFLLSGEQNYFVVLETLDTEEATYIWHTLKNKASLIEEVKQIDNQLSIIREKGRQTFLENSPDNFTRIIHDYSDNKKGFIIWKSAIEELI